MEIIIYFFWSPGFLSLTIGLLLNLEIVFDNSLSLNFYNQLIMNIYLSHNQSSWWDVKKYLFIDEVEWHGNTTERIPSKCLLINQWVYWYIPVLAVSEVTMWWVWMWLERGLVQDKASDEKPWPKEGLGTAGPSKYKVRETDYEVCLSTGHWGFCPGQIQEGLYGKDCCEDLNSFHFFLTL